MADAIYVVLVRNNETSVIEYVHSQTRSTLDAAVELAKRVAEYEHIEDFYYEVVRVIQLTDAQGGRRRFRYVEPPVQARVEEF